MSEQLLRQQSGKFLRMPLEFLHAVCGRKAMPMTAPINIIMVEATLTLTLNWYRQARNGIVGGGNYSALVFSLLIMLVAVCNQNRV